MSDLPEHVRINRAKWDDIAKEYVAAGELGWARDTPGWGIWHVPEAELHVLPDDLNGKDAIELGCGTAYVSSWLARRGALSWQSTIRQRSSRPRDACSSNTVSTSR